MRLSLDLDLSYFCWVFSEVDHLGFEFVDESLSVLFLDRSLLGYVVFASDWMSLSSLASVASCLVVSVVFSIDACTFLISLAVYLGEKEAVL